MSDPENPTAASDHDLVQRARLGNEDAFGTLMRTHYDRTYRLVYSVLRNEEDARDVCQEVWLSVWKQLSRFRGDAQFSSWLHPIAVRRALDHLRKRRRWFDRFLPLGGNIDDRGITIPEPIAPTPDSENPDTADRIALVKTALDSLPPKHRAVLALREIEGLSYEETATALHVPVGTVMSRLYHARRLLAQKLGAKS